MKEVYRELAERIRGELEDLQRVVSRATIAWNRAQHSPDEPWYLDSVALNLHGFYSGLERLFELIARQVDLNTPSGETWHRELLRQMAKDRPDVRPGVLGESTVARLDEFRRFRHLVRNLYTMNLDSERISGLLSSLPRLWETVCVEMLAFADFLDQLAQED